MTFEQRRPWLARAYIVGFWVLVTFAVVHGL